MPVTDAYDALAGARHSDPFSVLGPHVEDGRLVIRTFQPTAERVDVLHAGGPTELRRAHDTGVFEAPFSGSDIFDYRLRVTYPGGHSVDIDDPYRYGRVITEYDVYLFSQGKHTRIYDKLGAHLMQIGNAHGASCCSKRIRTVSVSSGRRSRHPSWRDATTNGKMRGGSSIAPAATRGSRSPSRSTKCTSARGHACRKIGIAG